MSGACGSAAGTSPRSQTTSHSQQQFNGEQAKQPEQILQDAIAAFSAPASLHLAVIIVSGANAVSATADFAGPSDVHYTVAGYDIEMWIVQGMIAIRASRLWLDIHPAAPAQIDDNCFGVSAADWPRVRADSTFVHATEFASRPAYVHILSTFPPPLRLGPQQVVDGQPTIPVVAAHGMTVYVSLTGSPVPVRIEDAGGTFDFSQYGTAPPVSIPNSCRSSAVLP